MKILSATVALLLPILPAAFAANPEDLYTRVGTDPTPAELLANGTIVPGESFSTRTVTGSGIVVNDALLEQETGVLGPFSSLSGVHIPTSGRRSDYANITRWYQQDGNTQIFRLFQGENNYRYDILAEAPPSRVEAVSPNLAVASGTWRVWEGTYTIIDPFGSTIFQLFHDGSDLWSFHLGMSGTGDISFNRRNSIPGLPDQITLATNMVGKSLAIKVRANGFNYEVYRKLPLVDANWILVTIGSYQQSPTNEVIFRFGMYPGSQPGTNSDDGMLFVSGAKFSVSTEPPVTPPPVPVTYYWDNNGSTAGFGTAGGTWTAPTTGGAAQGWSADNTGATEPASVTTNTYDPVNFGNGATGLAAGTIAVSGTVNSGSMSFASGSGKITLSGGTITLPDTSTLTVANNISGGNLINSVLAGAGSKLTVAGRYSLTLNGANTYIGQTILGDNTNTLTVRINRIADVGGGASSLGAPTTASKGLIQIGAVSRPSILEFVGASAAASTNRQVRIGSDASGSGGSTILNNNTNPSYTLTFSSPAFNPTTTTSSFSRNLTLGGSNPGDNTIAGAIIEHVGSGKLGLVKADAGTWVLAGTGSTYENTTAINAGILKIGAENVLPSGAAKGNVAVNAGASAAGTLDLNGFDLAINGLTGSTDTVLGRIVNNTTATNKTLTVGNADATATFNGIIANNTSGTGTIALTKVGTGTQTLTGPNTYSGNTTVSNGTLSLGTINSSNELSTVTIAASGILQMIFAGTDTVDKLFIGTSQKPAGTYGHSSTGATNGGLGVGALDAWFAVGTGTLTVTSSPPNDYSSWAALNSTAQTIDLDHDNDGVKNGIEYFLGGNANTTGFTVLPGVTNTSGTLSVTWPKAATYTGTYGTHFWVETSATLTGVWTPAALGAGANQVDITTVPGDVKYTFPAGTLNFARLKVTGP